MPADEKHLSALDALLEEPGATVTYKFLARHLDISANLAKKLLFAHVSRSSGASVATHVVSGWVKSGDVRAHVVRLARGVDGEVEAARKAMDEVTGEHVYSVSKASSDHPALTAVPASSVKQTDELFDAPPETPNALRDNRHSAVACALVKRAEGPARRVTEKPSPPAAPAFRAPAPQPEAPHPTQKPEAPAAARPAAPAAAASPEPAPAPVRPEAPTPPAPSMPSMPPATLAPAAAAAAPAVKQPPESAQSWSAMLTPEQTGWPAAKRKSEAQRCASQAASALEAHDANKACRHIREALGLLDGLH